MLNELETLRNIIKTEISNKLSKHLELEKQMISLAGEITGFRETAHQIDKAINRNKTSAGEK